MINEILQGRLNKSLQRFLGIKGAAPAPQLTPEIQAQIDLLSALQEMFYLRDEKLVGGGIEAPATVGNNSAISLQNPTGTGILVIPSLVWFHTTLAGGMLIDAWIAQTGLGGGVLASIQPADTRGTIGAGTVNRSVATISFTNKLGAFQHAGPGANDTLIPVPHIVLAPGSGLFLQGQVNNAAVGGGFLWRERPVSAEEVPTAGTG